MAKWFAALALAATSLACSGSDSGGGGGGTAATDSGPGTTTAGDSGGVADATDVAAPDTRAPKDEGGPPTDTGGPPKVCTPGELFCDSLVVKQCNPAGTAATFETDCEAIGKLCQFGACVDELTACLEVETLGTVVGAPVPAAVAAFLSVTTCEGEPALGLKSADFTVLEDGAVVAASANAQVIDLPQGIEVWITLLVDATGLLPAAAGGAALKDLASKLLATPKVTVWLRLGSVAKDLVIEQDFTRDPSAVAAAVDAMLGAGARGNALNLYGGIQEALQGSTAAMASRETAMMGGVLPFGQLVIVTAGADQTGLHTLDDAVSALAASGHDALALGVGDDLADGGSIDVSAIEKLGSHGAYVASGTADLADQATALRERAEALQQRLYLVGYCSPKLAGEHSVTVEVAGGLGSTGALTFDASAFGDGPACTGDFVGACAGTACGGLACGGCPNPTAQCSGAADGQCLCTQDAECDDGNGCTDDVCDPASGCSNPPNTADCDDGDACTGQDTCAGGACAGGPKVDCDDQNGCTDDSCDPASGCAWAPNTDPCDDESDCTSGDVCGGGTCTGSGIDCDDKQGCTEDTCDPIGGCANTPIEGSCDDGDECTTADGCTQGACVGGAPPQCDDNKVCTDDDCDSATGCTNTPNTIGCDDEDACTLSDTCAGGVCVGTDKDCDDKQPCTVDSCDESGTCWNTPTTDSCDDGDACTEGDTCATGSCAGTAVTCVDGEICTDDGCDSATGCTFTNNTLPCDDSDECTHTDVCSGGDCAGTAKDCSGTDQCKDFGCDTATGCTITPLTGTACDDGKYCTGPDTCANGSCFGPKETCEDNNECTADVCAEQAGINPSYEQPVVAGCNNLNVNFNCDDGEPCTQEICQDGACTVTAPKECPTAQCNTAACVDGTGCVFSAIEDGTPCVTTSTGQGVQACQAYVDPEEGQTASGCVQCDAWQLVLAPGSWADSDEGFYSVQIGKFGGARGEPDPAVTDAWQNTGFDGRPSPWYGSISLHGAYNSNGGAWDDAIPFRVEDTLEDGNWAVGGRFQGAGGDVHAVIGDLVLDVAAGEWEFLKAVTKVGTFVVAAGYRRAADGSTDGMYVKLNNGALTNTVYTSGPGDERFELITVMKSSPSRTVAVGSRTVDGTIHGLLFKFDSDYGTPKSQALITGATAPTRLLDAAAPPFFAPFDNVSAAFAVGSAGDNGIVVRFDDTLTVTWQKELAGPGGDALTLRGVRVLGTGPEGAYLQLWAVGDLDGAVGYVVVMDPADGTELWTKQLTPPDVDGSGPSGAELWDVAGNNNGVWLGGRARYPSPKSWEGWAIRMRTDGGLQCK